VILFRLFEGESRMRRIISFVATFLGLSRRHCKHLPRRQFPSPSRETLGSISGSGQPYAGVSVQLQNCPSPVAIVGYMGIVQQTYQIRASSAGLIKRDCLAKRSHRRLNA